MRAAFTEDQLLFRDAVRNMLEGECAADAVRAAWSAESGRVPGLWSKLGELGVLGMTTSEAAGGLGMNELDLVLPLEECGRAALPEPIVETTAVVLPLLEELESDGAQAALEWLSAACAGEATLTVGFDARELVANADTADLLVLVRDGAIHGLTRDQVTLTGERSVDGARRLFAVDFDAAASAPMASGDVAARVIERARDRAVLGVSAQLLGLASRMLEVAVDYAKIREQFGVAIGSFQAIKHQLADALLALEMARPVVYRAALSMADRAPGASVHVSMAKVRAATAAQVVGKTALQVHGAIGYSFEYDLHLWMKRAWSLANAYGTVAAHRERVAVALLDGDDDGAAAGLGIERVA